MVAAALQIPFKSMKYHNFSLFIIDSTPKIVAKFDRLFRNLALIGRLVNRLTARLKKTNRQHLTNLINSEKELF